MAKRLKFRICKFFQSCRSKDSSSTVPSTPLPCFLPLTLPPQKPHHPSSLGRRVSSADGGFAFTSRSSPPGDVDVEHNEPHGFRWQLQDKWHVVAKVVDHASTPRCKIYNSSVSTGCSASDNDNVLPLPPPRDRKKKKKKKKRRVGRKKTASRFRISTSSADSCGLFSSDGYDEIEGGETETLVSSSRSFSTESSSLETIRETPSQHRGAKKKKKKKKKKKEEEEVGRGSVSWSPARVSMLLRMVPCGVEGKVRESFAVVKRSEDPYEDFRRSMMEMILEKRMFEESDLEQLLHCFLSLNSTQHHALILKAFSEIWDALFATQFTQ